VTGGLRNARLEGEQRGTPTQAARHGPQHAAVPSTPAATLPAFCPPGRTQTLSLLFALVQRLLRGVSRFLYFCLTARSCARLLLHQALQGCCRAWAASSYPQGARAPSPRSWVKTGP